MLVPNCGCISECKKIMRELYFLNNKLVKINGNLYFVTGDNSGPYDLYHISNIYSFSKDIDSGGNKVKICEYYSDKIKINNIGAVLPQIVLNENLFSKNELEKFITGIKYISEKGDPEDLIENAQKELDELKRKRDKNSKSINNAEKKLNNAKKNLERLEENKNKDNEAIKSAESKLKNAKGALQNLNREEEENKEAIKSAESKLKNAEDAFKKFNGVFSGIKNNCDKLKTLILF